MTCAKAAVLMLQHKATYIALECKNCHTIKTLTCKPGIGGAMIPRVCDASAMGGEGNQCGQDPYMVIPSRSQFVDQQTLKLQVSLLTHTMAICLQLVDARERRLQLW